MIYKCLHMVSQGGVIGIKIGWMCDLDRADDECGPSYSFTRLDAMSQNNPVSPGYNFRYFFYHIYIYIYMYIYTHSIYNF